MALAVGEHAPKFSLPSKPREVVDMGAVIGQDVVVLLFFPLAFSSVCTAEMCHMRDDWRRFSDAGARVFGISVDSPFVTEKFRSTENIPFPILSDFNKEVSLRYGVLHADLFGLRGVSQRAVFVIDKAGTIVYAWATEDPGVQIKFDEVLAATTNA